MRSSIGSVKMEQKENLYMMCMIFFRCRQVCVIFFILSIHMRNGFSFFLGATMRFPLFLYVCVCRRYRGADAMVGYEEHYTYNRFIYELMADMLVKYVPNCLHIRNSVELYIEYYIEWMMVMALATYLRP